MFSECSLNIPFVLAGKDGAWPSKRAAAASVTMGDKLITFGGHAQWDLNTQVSIHFSGSI
jgi:hypothetical protein